LKQTSVNLPNPGWTLNLLLVFALGCGALLRYTDLSAPLLDFHPTRQLFGAIKARGIYYQSLPEAPAWQKDLAVRLYSVEATIEPPLMEQFSAAMYKYFGVQTAIPRAASATFWMLGGIFLYRLAKNLSGTSFPAAAALAFYLLTPYSITASRAFQPDPLMMLLLLIFWWSFEIWGRQLSWKWALVAGVSGGLAIFVKFTAAFFVSGAALGVIFAYTGVKKSIKNLQTWVIVLLGVLPPGIYLIYGTFIAGFLDQQFAGRFYPDMWINPVFYLRWLLKLNNVVHPFWLALAIVGWLLSDRKPVKIFLGTLWATYFLYGMISTHHISTHDYYSLFAIPLAALCLAQLFARIARPSEQGPAWAHSIWVGCVEKIRSSRSLQIIGWSVLLSSILLFSIGQYTWRLKNDFRSQAAFWEQVGDATGHQPGVLALTTDYGYPLAYYGWQKSSLWPLSENIKDFEHTFSELTANKAYFLITDFEEYERQPELQNRLTKKYPILKQGQGFIMFDLLHPKL
jgi:hypothetical protein